MCAQLQAPNNTNKKYNVPTPEHNYIILRLLQSLVYSYMFYGVLQCFTVTYRGCIVCNFFEFHL